MKNLGVRRLQGGDLRVQVQTHLHLPLPTPEQVAQAQLLSSTQSSANVRFSPPKRSSCDGRDGECCLPSLPSPKIANVDYHRPERRLEGLPAASLPLESLKKSYKSDASAAKELRVGSEIAFSSGRRDPSKGSPESITLSVPGEPQRMRTLQRPLNHRLDSPVPPALLWGQGTRRSSGCAFGKVNRVQGFPSSRRWENPQQDLHQLSSTPWC